MENLKDNTAISNNKNFKKNYLHLIKESFGNQ